MAIVKIQSDQPDANNLQVNINNGDLRALHEIKQKWGFKDLESVLRFALAALMITDDGDLYVVKKDGSKKSIKPVDELLISKDSSSD